jgi:hypothetical protein
MSFTSWKNLAHLVAGIPSNDSLHLINAVQHFSSSTLLVQDPQLVITGVIVMEFRVLAMRLTIQQFLMMMKKQDY